MRFRPRRLHTTADISRGGKEPILGRIKGIVSAVVLLGALYLGLGICADLAVNLVPPRTEAQWFAWAEDMVEPTLPVPDDLQLVFNKLILDSQLDDFPYHLVYLPSEDINAFALPGGMIAVTQGLYENVRTAEGRALVLGHEIGHVQHRHGLQRIGRSILLAGALSLCGVDTATVLKRSQFLADLQFSRSQESESDDFGLRLVHRTFGTTLGSLEFFENLESLQVDSNDTLQGQLGTFLRTHPRTSDRLEDLRALAEELDGA
ncbi:MAG: M48 family metallopeptidase [Planctomycetota bacterium]|nr:M48 family metallopeptidase [Planctomycetota bacterium]MDA1114200.1 M48 family metallopeptidase [Planctomycetota bacterium]